MNTFHLVEFPDAGRAWCVVLSWENLEALHRHVSVTALRAYQSNPHMREGFEQISMHPIRLGAGWLSTATSFLIRGEPAIVQSKGGMCTLDGVRIIQTVQQEKLTFPAGESANEVITLSEWVRGGHWYITSSTGRVFDPVKYDTLDQARDRALQDVPASRLKVKEALPDNAPS